jgi:predicted transcriptional regulator of viral defense system
VKATQGPPVEDLLHVLPPTFTYSRAKEAGLSDRQLYWLRDQGIIEVVSRGLFRRADADALADVDLLSVARRAPMATLCLTSALARHELTDEIPGTIDVALPRGTYHPVVPAPVTWHSFDPETFAIGRTSIPLDQLTIGLYDEPRSIVDAARLRHLQGNELFNVALKRWLGRRGSSPSELLAIARHFPRAERAIREALEILL